MAWLLAAFTAGAAAVALYLPAREHGTRVKGGTQLGFFVKRGTQVSSGAQGEHVRPGDLVRFTYSSERARYFALFDRDVNGARVYFPTGTHATRLAAGADVALDFSVELDATLGLEQMYTVFCDASFELEPLRAALASQSKLEPASGCRIERVTLEKEPAR